MKFKKLISVKTLHDKGYNGEIGVYRDELIFCFEDDDGFEFSFLDLAGNISDMNKIRIVSGNPFDLAFAVKDDIVFTLNFVMRDKVVYPISHSQKFIFGLPFFIDEDLVYKTSYDICVIPRFFENYTYLKNRVELYPSSVLDETFPAGDNCIIFSERDPSGYRPGPVIVSLCLFDINRKAVVNKYNCKLPCHLSADKGHFLLYNYPDYVILDKSLNEVVSGNSVNKLTQSPRSVFLADRQSYISYSSNSKGTSVMCINLEDGELVWDNPIINAGSVNYGVYVDNDYLLYCCGNGGKCLYLVKVDIDTGRQEVVCDLPRGNACQVLRINDKLAVLVASKKNTSVYLSDSIDF